MLSDSCEFVPSSTATALRVASGPQFPTAPEDGVIFRLTATQGMYDPGQYYWSEAESKWISGDITSVTAGTGLTGGGDSGAVTLAIDLDWLNANVAPPATQVIPYDVYSFIDGKPSSGEVLLRLKAGRAFNIVENFAGSRCDANAAAASQAILLVKRNGVQINTITFAANSKSGTFGNSAALSVQAGDLLEVICPIVQDTTLSSVTICIIGNL